MRRDAPEPMDKLDTTTGYSFSTPVVGPVVPVVNGPEDERLNWDTVQWRTHEANVRRLRQRIFTATRKQDWATVRNLQRLMLRSYSNTLLSVRQVTQRNAGRKTAGIDGEIALSSPERAEVAMRVHATIRSWQPRAVKRVYIPKSGNKAKLRPLGIPVLMDRAHQARVRNALEPEWEARFEPKSYGFRPGRGCHDAIEATFNTVCRRDAKRGWILDADLAGAFDRIEHSQLLETLGDFPAKGMIADWLKAGVFEPGKGFSPTEEGTPQGGVISPALLNVALHGLEEAAGVRYHTGNKAGEAVPGSPVVIRYADDVIALCHSQGQAEQFKARLAEWLAPRGLAFNDDKTVIRRLTEGVEFLGFRIRRYRNGKLLITPSPEAVKRVKRRLAREMRSLRGSNVRAVLARLAPIIRGWSAYYRSVVSSRTFAALDNYLWKLLYKWACWTHANKPKPWIISRYFGKFNKFRNDRWVFGDRETGVYLPKFSWTPIIRHTLVQGMASPDDPALAGYWADRRRRVKPPIDGYTLRLLTRQDGRCPLCGEHLLSPDQPPQSPQAWEQWWLGVARRAIAADYLTHHGRDGPPDGNQTRLVHASCHRGHLVRQRRSPAHQPAPPSGTCLRRVR
jgi:RNA-directed DNA polymerase